jgi:hypothetical protein
MGVVLSVVLTSITLIGSGMLSIYTAMKRDDPKKVELYASLNAVAVFLMTLVSIVIAVVLL